MNNKSYLKLGAMYILPVITLVFTILIFFDTRKFTESRYSEIEKITYSKKVEVCGKLGNDAVKVLFHLVYCIESDSTELRDSIISLKNDFNKTVIMGMPVLSDSLLSNIREFNETLREITDSLASWDKKYPIRYSTLYTSLYNQNPLSSKLQTKIDNLIYGIRKETGGSEVGNELKNLFKLRTIQ